MKIMEDQVEINKHDITDAEQIVSLLEKSFIGWPKFDLSVKPTEHYKWKYTDNSGVFTAKINDKIIGTHCYIPTLLNLNNQILKCGYGSDVCVDPECRRRGIHNRLLIIKIKAAKEAGLYFLYNMTGNPIVVAILDKSPDFLRFPINLTQYVRIHDLANHLKHFPIERSWLENLGFKTLSKIWPMFIPKKNIQYENIHEVFTCHSFLDSRFDAFLDSFKECYDLFFQRNKDFLEWRYCDSRAGSFHINFVEENDKILGFIVLRVNKLDPSYPMGYIVDLMVAPDRRDVVEELLKEAIIFFDELNINIISFLQVKGCSYEHILRKYGFIDSKRTPYVFISSLSDSFNVNEFTRIPKKRAYISYGDFDVV